MVAWKKVVNLLLFYKKINFIFFSLQMVEFEYMLLESEGGAGVEFGRDVEMLLLLKIIFKN